MKRKYIRYGILFLLIIVILMTAILVLKAGQNKNLFKQELPENTLAGGDGEALYSYLEEDRAEAAVRETIPQENAGLDEKQQEKFKDRRKGLPEIAAGEDSNKEQVTDMEAWGQEVTKTFYYEELSQEIKDRISGKSYGENCKVLYEELRYISVLYWGFDDRTHTGEMIVNRAIAEDVVEIFKELYEAKYPIEQMVLVDEYDADDNTSMAANNSSAFNYRVIEGTSRISLHGYGLAVDINPLYNPYVHSVNGERVVTPVEGAKYEDRTLDCPYYISEGDICYQAFIKRGFTWGGEWKNNKDYQHFQKAIETE
jgi:hypothetical protein